MSDETLLESFRAVVMGLVLHYRGRPGVTQLPSFAREVENERDRYLAKHPSRATVAALNDICDRAITHGIEHGISMKLATVLGSGTLPSDHGAEAAGTAVLVRPSPSSPKVEETYGRGAASSKVFHGGGRGRGSR